ncbi:hypothetical protein SAMN03080617_03304 [Algoriphagus alkaliphilus]|uniref:Outer membrane protein beta-barrel domain-containing protein n=1 Tax=Algoriphagus alkaliphilus TaxID=279824 RepID=A0A1G5Z6F5_9BACT|nr:hypothetical protein [Algoriphagus alkaliphilus]SDA90478.1 hypothetical protein SAMN03080617_03304 [Algoriphagus alkaliphilus]
MNSLFKPVLIGFFLVFLTLSQFTFAQTEPDTFTAKNAIYLELGGSSGRYAINYNKIFHQKGKLKLNASAGFSMWRDQINNFKTIWLPVIPLEVSALYGKSNHHLELGFGVTSYLSRTLDFNSESLELEDKVVFDAFIPLRVGYRYQKPEGGFFFRVGYTPIFILPTGGREGWIFEPRFAGVSFGKSF